MAADHSLLPDLKSNDDDVKTESTSRDPKRQTIFPRSPERVFHASRESGIRANATSHNANPLSAPPRVKAGHESAILVSECCTAAQIAFNKSGRPAEAGQ